MSTGVRENAAATAVIDSLSLPKDVFTDKGAFIRQVRSGIPGRLVKEAIQALNDRKFFALLLETESSNLHRVYKQKALGRAQSEAILDVLKLYINAVTVFGDTEKAHEWLYCEVPALSGSRPIDLLDTFQGRDWVREVLEKIEFGEFS